MNQYEILNSEISDLDFACYLFIEAIKYQERKGYPLYKSSDRPLLKNDIENACHYKLMIDDDIACMFSAIRSDELIWREKNKDKAIYLHRIVVNPKYKGRKLLGEILDWTKQKAKEDDALYIRIDTWADNPDLVNYYTRFGFEVIEYFKIPDIEDVPINCRGNKVVLMEYSLSLLEKPL